MIRKRFEVRKSFVRTNCTHGFSEQSADSSEEPKRCPCPTPSCLTNGSVNFLDQVYGRLETYGSITDNWKITDLKTMK